MADVDEAGFFEPGDVVSIVRDGAVVGRGGFGDKGGPGGEGVGGKEGVVIGGEAAIEFLELEVTAGFGVSGKLPRVVSGWIRKGKGRERVW